MPDPSLNVLAFGADGKFAGLVVDALVRRPQVKLRGFIRAAKHGDELRARGADEVVVGDLGDTARVEDAMRGMDVVFYIAPVALPDEERVGTGVVDAAKRAGVRRIVFSSVIHPVLRLENHRAKSPVEAAILDSGLEYTLLHPTVFFQNYEAVWAKLLQSGVLAEPWSNETRFSRVDYRDVAEAAAIAATEDRLLYGTFELCAEGRLNRHEVAAMLGRILGRSIEAARIDPDTLPAEAAPLLPMFKYYDHAGLLGNALTLRAILGREPISLERYFEELAQGKQSNETEVAA